MIDNQAIVIVFVLFVIVGLPMLVLAIGSIMDNRRRSNGITGRTIEKMRSDDGVALGIGGAIYSIIIIAGVMYLAS